MRGVYTKVLRAKLWRCLADRGEHVTGGRYRRRCVRVSSDGRGELLRNGVYLLMEKGAGHDVFVVCVVVGASWIKSSNALAAAFKSVRIRNAVGGSFMVVGNKLALNVGRLGLTCRVEILDVQMCCKCRGLARCGRWVLVRARLHGRLSFDRLLSFRWRVLPGRHWSGPGGQGEIARIA